jgi:signal transduction histidine kinase
MVAATLARLPARLDRSTWVDVGIAGFVAAVGVGDVSSGGFHPAWLWLVGAFVTSAVLLWLRRHPGVVAVAVLVPWTALHLVQPSTGPDSDPAFPILAVLVASYSLGAFAPPRVALGGLVFELAYFNVGGALSGDTAIANFVFISFFLMSAWLLGRALGGRTRYASALERHTELLEAEREAQSRRAVAVERARIARELHDVIAHGVSLMVLQTGGVRRLLAEDQKREREALEAAEATGREALSELHLLLGVLRAPDAAGAPEEPPPGLGRLDALVDSVRAAGLDIAVEVSGKPRQLPRAMDLSAYRIVQEALTNTLRHGHARHADIHVAYGRRTLELEVLDDGIGEADANGTGNGLVGMRERTAMFGGALHAGPRAEGGFAVRALLPLDRAGT